MYTLSFLSYDLVCRQTYYFNPRTGRATWEKPRLLRRPSDIKVPIYLPEPDRGLLVPCSVCVGENKVARHFCVECAEFYCAADFDKSHRKGTLEKAAKVHTVHDQCVCRT